MRVTLLGVPVLACVVNAAAPARASDIIDEWGTAKVPPKPELKAVTLDPKTTAVLLLDLGKGTCAMRPRCVGSVPNAKRIHDAARAAGAMVYYTSTPVPVDCMSSEDPYMEQYAAWHMYKGGPNVVTANTTLTRSTMIKF